jgi:ankyrin repeat protein
MKELIRACWDNDLDKVNKLLDEGANINKVEHSGYVDKEEEYEPNGIISGEELCFICPVEIACIDNKLELLRLLIKRGADIDIIDGEGIPPLHRACDYNYIEIVRELLDNGVDVNRTDYCACNNTAIHSACKRKNINIEMIQLLLERGADINRTDDQKNTPLMLLCYYEDNYHERLNIIRELLDRGVDINNRNSSGETGLHIAISCNNLRVMRELIKKGANINIKDNWKGQTPLHTAIKKKNINCVRILLENNADIEIKNKEGHTPLQLACKYNRHEIVMELFKHNANLDAVNINKILKKHRDKYIELIQREREMRIRRKNKNTILNMRFDSNYWRKIRDMRQINAGNFTVC